MVGTFTRTSATHSTLAGTIDSLGLLTDILPEEREAVISFNEKLVDSSKGQLAPVDRDLVKYLTLAGSHTSQG